MIYKLSPNEAERIIKDEQARKRVLRILTVREQSKKNSENLLKSVFKEKERLFDDLVVSLKKKWNKENEKLILETENIIYNKLKEVGQSHQQAFNSDYAGELAAKLLDFKANQIIANERFKSAIDEQRKHADDKAYAENKHIFDRLIALEVEKQRSAFIASLPNPPTDPIDNLDLKLLSKKPDILVPKIMNIKVERHYSGDDAIEKAVKTEMDAESRFDHKQKEILKQRQKAMYRHNAALHKQSEHIEYEKSFNEFKSLQKVDPNLKMNLNKIQIPEKDNICQVEELESISTKDTIFQQIPITFIGSNPSEIMLTHPVSCNSIEDITINADQNEQKKFPSENTGTFNNALLPGNIFTEKITNKSEIDLGTNNKNIYTSVNSTALPELNMYNSKAQCLNKDVLLKSKNVITSMSNSLLPDNIKTNALKFKKNVSSKLKDNISPKCSVLKDEISTCLPNSKIDINCKDLPLEKNINVINLLNSPFNIRTDISDNSSNNSKDAGNFDMNHKEFNLETNEYKDIAKEEIPNESLISDKTSNTELESKVFEVNSGKFGDGVNVVNDHKAMNSILDASQLQNLKKTSSIHSNVLEINSNISQNLNQTPVLSEGEISHTISLSNGELSDIDKFSFSKESHSNLISTKKALQNNFPVYKEIKFFLNNSNNGQSTYHVNKSNTVSTNNIVKTSSMQGDSLSSISSLSSDFLAKKSNNFGQIELDSPWQNLQEVSQFKTLPISNTEALSVIEPNINGNFLYLQSSHVSNDSTDTASTIYLELPHKNDNLNEFNKLCINNCKNTDNERNLGINTLIKGVAKKNTDISNINGISSDANFLNSNTTKYINLNKNISTKDTKYKFLNDDILNEDYRNQLKDFLYENISADSSLSFNQLSISKLNHLLNSTPTTSTPLVLDISSFASTDNEANLLENKHNLYKYCRENTVNEKGNIGSNNNDNSENIFSSNVIEFSCNLNEINVDLNQQKDDNLLSIFDNEGMLKILNLNNNNINIHENVFNLSSGTLTENTSHLITLPIFNGAISDDGQSKENFKQDEMPIDSKSNIIIHPPYIDGSFNVAASNISELNSQDLAELYRIYFDSGSVETSETCSYLNLPIGYDAHICGADENKLVMDNLAMSGKLLENNLQNNKTINCNDLDEYFISNGDNYQKVCSNLTNLNDKNIIDKNLHEVSIKNENLKKIISNNLNGDLCGIRNWAEILKPFQKKIESKYENGIMEESMISLVSANFSLTDHITNIQSSDVNNICQKDYTSNKGFCSEDLASLKEFKGFVFNKDNADKETTVFHQMVNNEITREGPKVDNDFNCEITNKEKYHTSRYNSQSIRMKTSSHKDFRKNIRSKSIKPNENFNNNLRVYPTISGSKKIEWDSGPYQIDTKTQFKSTFKRDSTKDSNIKGVNTNINLRTHKKNSKQTNISKSISTENIKNKSDFIDHDVTKRFSSGER